MVDGNVDLFLNWNMSYYDHQNVTRPILRKCQTKLWISMVKYCVLVYPFLHPRWRVLLSLRLIKICFLVYLIFISHYQIHQSQIHQSYNLTTLTKTLFDEIFCHKDFSTDKVLSNRQRKNMLRKFFHRLKLCFFTLIFLAW